MQKSMRINNDTAYMLTVASVRYGLNSYKTYVVTEICQWVRQVWSTLRMGQQAVIIEDIEASLRQDARLPSTENEWKKSFTFLYVRGVIMIVT